MKQNKKVQKVRAYLKKYVLCKNRFEYLDQYLKTETCDTTCKILSEDKDRMSVHCENVLLIMNYLAPDSLARQILDKLYIQGLSMDLTADALGYSYGYCANVEAEAMKQLSQIQEVVRLIGFIS